jgi:hypothetical protein
MKKHYFLNPKYAWLEKDLSKFENKSKIVKDFYPELQKLDQISVRDPRDLRNSKETKDTKDLTHQENLQDSLDLQNIVAIEKNKLNMNHNNMEDILEPLLKKILSKWGKKITKQKKNKIEKTEHEIESKIFKLIKNYKSKIKKNYEKKTNFIFPLIIGIQGSVIFFLLVLLGIFVFMQKNK